MSNCIHFAIFYASSWIRSGDQRIRNYITNPCFTNSTTKTETRMNVYYYSCTYMTITKFDLSYNVELRFTGLLQ